MFTISRFLLAMPPIVLSTLFGGCTLMEATADRALISRHTGEVRAVATRADRRITFVDENWMWGEDRERENVAYRMTMTSDVTPADQYMFEHYRAHHYCAEPSPDVSQDLISRLAAEFGDGGLGLSGQLDSAAGIESLFNRSQGVQLFRDGLFALCQAHHNGAVGADEYGLFIASLIERTSYLIALELALSPAGNNPGGELTGVAEIVDTALTHMAPKSRYRWQGDGMVAAGEPAVDCSLGGCVHP